MATGDAIDRIYGRAASFGRDVFHYIVTGTVFALVCSAPLWPRIRLESSELSKWQSAVTDAGVQLAALLVAAIVLFCLGHLLSCVGFWIRNKIMLPCNSCWDRAWHGILAYLCCRSEMEKNENTRREIVTICKSEFSHLTVDDKRDVHVGLEMVVFEKRRQLHANYIERYNTLWHRVRLFCVGGPEGSRRGCERHGKSYLTLRRRGEAGDGGGSLTGGAIPSA